jgi:hypothetical protein
MEYSLKRDETILLYLKVFIPIPELCNKIIKIKNEDEKRETLKYHSDRWENIVGEYYYTRDNHTGKFSYIFDNINYVIKPDHRRQFYNLTGVSYQIVELIHELIRILHEDSWDFEIDEKKDWLSYDDSLYSELSKKIMNEMRKIL